MNRLRRLTTMLSATIAVVMAALPVNASLYPTTVYPGVRALPRLPAAADYFERHYGQLRYTGTAAEMVVTDWSSRELRMSNETSEELGRARVTFAAYVYTSSSSATRQVECEAVGVDATGWASTWTGRIATTSSGWQPLHMGSLDFYLSSGGAIVECTMNRYSRIGYFSTFSQAF